MCTLGVHCTAAMFVPLLKETAGVQLQSVKIYLKRYSVPKNFYTQTLEQANARLPHADVSAWTGFTSAEISYWDTLLYTLWVFHSFYINLSSKKYSTFKLHILYTCNLYCKINLQTAVSEGWEECRKSFCRGECICNRQSIKKSIYTNLNGDIWT